MNTIIKSAAAFAATFFFAGAAFAEDVSRPVEHAVDQTALMQNIYAAMDDGQSQAAKFVLVAAETRLADKIANIEVKKPSNPAPVLVVASR